MILVDINDLLIVEGLAQKHAASGQTAASRRYDLEMIQRIIQRIRHEGELHCPAPGKHDDHLGATENERKDRS